MASISTRLATLCDLEPLATLFDAYRQFYELQPDLALAREFIRQRLEQRESLVILATDNQGALIGFAQLYPTFCSLIAAPIYILSDLFVTPLSRKTGAGRALLCAAESLAQENGVARLDLTTARTNKRAQALYESQGWARDEIYFAYNRAIVG